MNSIFDKLNLRPAERRLVLIVALTVFVLLNAFFVWPRFGEGTRLQNRMKAAEDGIFRFQREVDRTGEYRRKLAELEKAGAAVPSEDQALNLSQTVLAQAALSGIQVSYVPTPRTTSSGKTNQFFDEQTGMITVQPAEEKALVDFLYHLGAGGSMIRVFSMTLAPDPGRHKLQGNITLVASYARKTAPRTVPAATPARTNPPAIAAASGNAAPANAAARSAAPRGTGPTSRTASPFPSRTPRTNAPTKK